MNPENRLLHVYGDSSKIFKPLRGEIATEVTKMVVLPLQLPLNTALYRARKEKKSVIYTDIQLEHTNGHYSISLKVIPPEPKGKNGDFYLVEIQQEALAPSPEVPQVEQFKVSHEAQQRILELEHELQHTHENLQASIEELETTNEELTVSNEELHTVNIEYQSKIQELTQLNNDVDNLLKSTDIGVIFLDEQLKIRKFTPAATAAISLRHTDLERPLKELTLKIECPQLLELLEEVLENSQSLELEVKLKEHDSYFWMRINPYRTEERRNEGVVISFVQINEIKKVQRQLENTLVELDHTLIELENSKGEINRFFHLSLDMLCIASLDGYFNQINFSFSRILGHSSKELLARPFIDFVHPDDVEATLQEVQKLAEGHDTIGFENRYRCQDGSYRWLKWMATSYQGLIYATAHDLTEQKLAQELQIRQLAALETASDGIAILNDNKFIYLNQAHLEIFGYSQPEELIGQSWQVLYEPEQLIQLEREVFPILSERGRWQGETKAKHRDGHTFDEELTLTFTPKGDLICVCRDISEIKQARQQLVRANIELEQRVIERTQTLADFSDRLKQVHRLATTNYSRLEDLFADYIETGCQIFNLTTGIVSQVSDNTYTILAVRSPLNLSVGFEADYQDTYCAEVIEKQTTLSFHHVGAMENMKGHPVYQNLRLESFISTPIFVNGNIFGTLNFSDTTPREQPFQSHEREILELMARNMGHSLAAWQSKTALEESRTELQQANRAKDNFIAHMNNELRTPLNGILGFTQILQKDPHLTKQQNQNLSLIHQSGQHLLDLINDIL
ncbi:MAG: PAS domain S-box protein, partial [Xenococcaceae cyanobacterium MO_188.B32]|nr:PAS domain S-box protein [Xenococcaceae cyanobacterium MO_188.B32]